MEGRESAGMYMGQPQGQGLGWRASRVSPPATGLQKSTVGGKARLPTPLSRQS